MSNALTKEVRTLLEKASEMFDETGCVPGFDGEEVPAGVRRAWLRPSVGGKREIQKLLTARPRKRGKIWLWLGAPRPLVGVAFVGRGTPMGIGILRVC